MYVFIGRKPASTRNEVLGIAVDISQTYSKRRRHAGMAGGEVAEDFIGRKPASTRNEVLGIAVDISQTYSKRRRHA